MQVGSCTNRIEFGTDEQTELTPCTVYFKDRAGSSTMRIQGLMFGSFTVPAVYPSDGPHLPLSP